MEQYNLFSRFESTVAEEECKTCNLPFAPDVPQYYIPTSLPKPVWTGGGEGGLLPGLFFCLFIQAFSGLVVVFVLFCFWKGGGGGVEEVG